MYELSAVHKARITAWVAALRSGEFKQGKGALHRGDTYCCLGVACEVSGLGTWGEHYSGCSCLPCRVYPRIGYKVNEESQTGILPESVAKWFGFQDSNPGLDNNNCTILNDDLGYSFEQIADLIEAEFLQ